MSKMSCKGSGIAHPLERIVLDALQEHEAIDPPILFQYLTGVTWFSGKYAAVGNKAYLTVARDVLDCMTSQGKLRVDEDGWYRLTGGIES